MVGTGGSAEVFRARDTLTGQDVAFKRLRATADDTVARARFEREARILAGIDSPHVVAYVAHGTDDDGRLCLVTEWLQGETIDETLDRERPNDWTVLRILYESSLGLTALHDVGVVHRDVKPANLFLASTGEGITVRVIDLGIAIGEDDLGVTATGIVVGSPVYIAPERLAGQPPSAASDVYSLAVVFFELLTGVRPFESDRTGETLRRIVHDPPPNLRALRPDLPLELDALVTRALDKDPMARPGSAMEFADQATSILSLVTTQPDGVPEATVLGRIELRVRSFVLVRLAKDSPPERSRAIALALRRRGARVDRSQDPSRGEVWAIFGDPRLVGDEPRRAARAAFRMSARDTTIAVTTGLLRVGATSPEGPAVRRAHRLAETTEPGTVSLDDATAVMLGSAYTVAREAHGARLLGVQGAPKIFGLSGVDEHGEIPPGRAREHQLVCGVVTDAWAVPTPTVVVVWGDAGMGKTRLGRAVADALTESAGADGAHPFLTIAGDAAASSTPSGALGRALRELSGVQAGASAREQRACLDAVLGAFIDNKTVSALAELTRVHAEVSELFELPQREPVAMGDGGPRAVIELLRAACTEAPRMVVLEDLHWVDEASLELVARAIDALAELPLAVVAMGRPEPQAVQRVQRAWAGLAVTELRLGPLAPSVCHGIAREALGAEASPALREAIVSRAGGNPLFLEELLRVAEGAIDARPDALRGLTLPIAAMSAVQLRLDGLGPEIRRVARAASVFGMTFWRRGLEAILGSTPATFIDRALDALSRAGFISPRPSSRVVHTSEWTFHHALARDAAYATLVGEDRSELHAHAARWLEAVGARDAAEVARHFELAGLGAEARLRWFTAARSAFFDQAFSAAREYATRALARGPSADERRELLCIRAEASFALADATTGLDDARAAESIAGATAPARLRVALCVAQGHSLAGRPEAGLAVLRSARAITLSTPRGERDGQVPGWLWLTATLRQAQTMVQRGMADEALALLDETAGDSRNSVEDHDTVRSLDDAVRSSALLALGRLEDALVASRNALGRARRDGDIPRLLQGSITEGRTLTRLGQQHHAVRKLATARDDARRLGLALYEVQALQHLGVALARSGSTQDGLHAIGQALALAERHRLPRAEVSVRLSRSWVQSLVDDPGDVEPSLTWLARARIELRFDAPVACLLRAVHARLLLRYRDGDGAVTSARAAAQMRTEGLALLEGDAMVDLALVEALLSEGLRNEAESALRDAIERVNAVCAGVTSPELALGVRTQVAEHLALDALGAQLGVTPHD